MQWQNGDGKTCKDHVENQKCMHRLRGKERWRPTETAEKGLYNGKKTMLRISGWLVVVSDTVDALQQGIVKQGKCCCPMVT